MHISGGHGLPPALPAGKVLHLVGKRQAQEEGSGLLMSARPAVKCLSAAPCTEVPFIRWSLVQAQLCCRQTLAIVMGVTALGLSNIFSKK